MNFITGILVRLAQSFFANLLKKYYEFLKKKKEDADRDKTDKKNAEELKDAIKEGKTDEEISKRAEDFLNTIKCD